jgi:hypothetical protein
VTQLEPCTIILIKNKKASPDEEACTLSGTSVYFIAFDFIIII